MLSGAVSQGDLAWTQGQDGGWRPLGDLLREAGCVIPPPPPQPVSMLSNFAGSGSSPDVTARRIADYERISGYIWIAIGVVQCIALITIIAGIWNIFAGVSRVRSCPFILARDSSVPEMFEGIGGLIIIGVINFLFGAMIGVVFIIFDFFIRDMVLKNRHIFDFNGTQHA